MNGIASKHRDDSVDDNLKRFDEMRAGSQEGLRWCIRAKMSVDNPNKALRDPVVYRCNVSTHHRTGYVWCSFVLFASETDSISVINGKCIQRMTSRVQLSTPSRVSHMH